MTRYRFFQPSDDLETGVYLRQMNAIEAFWQRFRHVSGRRASTWISELRGELGKVAPELGLEVRETNAEQRSLYVLPVAGTEHTPLALAFTERAPELSGWHYAVEREGVDLESGLSATRKDTGLDLSRSRVRVGVGRGHGLEVVLASEHFRAPDQDSDLDAAHQLCNQLLGDRLLNHWVSNVSTLPQPRPSPLRLLGADKQLLPLDVHELRPSVEAAVRGIEQGLPDQPCHANCEHADWVMFDCAAEHEGAAEGPAHDLMMACTMRPEMLKWHLQGGDFSSRRFSRFGEQFCYLKLRSGEDIQAAAERRVELEEQLDRWLVPGRLGCVVGAGPGRHFQYIQLALTDLQHAITLLQRQLETAYPPGGWLLFCDSEWRHEWIDFGAGAPPIDPT